MKQEDTGMNYEDITITSRDHYRLSARLFDTGSPKAVVNVLHGMEEHKERYDRFASILQENGFAVLTCDMRGHGKDAPHLSHIADKGGDRLLVEDVRCLSAWLRKRYPGTLQYLFAHSMGTIIARRVLQSDSRYYDKVILSGYPVPQKAAAAGILLSGVVSMLCREGKKGRSAMVTNMAMGGFSKAVKDAKTPLDWLSYNDENVRKYQDDPLCGRKFTLGSYDALFRLVRDIANPDLCRNVRNDLPMLLISGEDDPCTGGESGRQTSLKALRDSGFENIEVVTLDNMRHEILNEKDHDKAEQAILGFMEQ